MDLREVLAEAFADATMKVDGEGVPYIKVLDDDAAADVALARLSQPDVLDEFERRMRADATRWIGRESRAVTARRTLSDMLGGGS